VHREPDDVYVFLQRDRGDALGRLAEPGVDDLHPRVPQDAGDDLGAAIVAVESDFGHQHPNRGGIGTHALARSTQVPKTVSSVWVISPTVT
jgi:hypothetical protein